MKSVIVLIDKDTVRGGRAVQRWVCNRGHPHPTEQGAVTCEAARAGGATDNELQLIFDAEVAAQVN